MNLEQELHKLKVEIGSIGVQMHGYNKIGRQSKTPFNDTSWKMWYESLTLEEKEAERELRRRGYYNHEGCDTMVRCKDVNGAQLHTDDLVTYGDPPIEAMITCIFSEDEIQINPIGEGLPELVQPSTVTQKASFIEKLRKLSTVEELQAILLNAETRCKQELEARIPAKRTSNAAPRQARQASGNTESEDL
jgi:hypothetical protein